MKTLTILIFIITSLSATNLHAESKQKVEFLNSGVIFSKSSALPFSEAVRVGDTIYLSGQIGVIPHTKDLVEGGVAAETKQAMNNIKSTLEANDLSMNNIIKCTIMLADISEWPKFNEVYKTFFSEPYPARSAFGANGLALGSKVEIECLAVDY